MGVARTRGKACSHEAHTQQLLLLNVGIRGIQPNRKRAAPGLGRNLICLIFGVCVANDGEGENDAPGVSETKNGRNQPENQFRTHNLRGKSANNGWRNMARILLRARGELKLTGLAAAEERLNAHTVDIPPTACAHTFKFTPPPQRDTPHGRLPKLPISAPIW